MNTNIESISETGNSPFLKKRKITCVVPDDGTERKLIQSLSEEKGILSVTSKSCRGIGILRQSLAKRGKLPESELVRLVYIIVPDEQVYEMFNYIYELAEIGKPGGGLMWMGPVIDATPYTLPGDLPDETSQVKHPGS